MSGQWLYRRGSYDRRQQGQGSVRMDGPDERKFEKDTSDITLTIRALENKLKPVASNTTQLIVAEIAKETAVLADSETIKEAITVEIKGIDVKMHEIGVKYKESKIVASDLLAGVRHKTEGRHDEAVDGLELVLIRRHSSVEERKFRREIDALKKSKERLIEYNAAKHVVDTLKEQQETLRDRRHSLYRQDKEVRVRDKKEKVAKLKLELEEVKERRKVSPADKEEIKKEIIRLSEERKQLFSRFRSEQLAFKERLQQQSEEERMRRNMTRAMREDQRKYRAIEQSFQHGQLYFTCSALISHLQRLSLSPSNTGAPLTAADLEPPSNTGAPLDPSSTGSLAAAEPDLDEPSSPLGAAATNLDLVPGRSASAPTGKEGGFILRRERDEVLVPTSVVTLKRKKSKKEKKRNIPVVSRKLNLNPTIFRQFSSLDVSPPSNFSDIPQALSHLQGKLAYLEGMTKCSLVPLSLLESMVPADSGLGSITSDLVDRDTDFLNSQEDTMNLDPGLGSGTSPRRSISEANGGVAPSKLPTALPQRSASTANKAAVLSSEDDAMVRLYDNVLPPNLVSMASSSTGASNSGTSITVETVDE